MPPNYRLKLTAPSVTPLAAYHWLGKRRALGPQLSLGVSATLTDLFEGWMTILTSHTSTGKHVDESVDAEEVNLALVKIADAGLRHTE